MKISSCKELEETYGLTSQMRRASVSILSNIAEGYMRGSKEYVQHLRIALGSCAEMETQIISTKLDYGFNFLTNRCPLNAIR